MMAPVNTAVLLLAYTSLSLSQSLLSALSTYPQTSTFQSLLQKNTSGILNLIPSSKNDHTIFIPSDNAFLKYAGNHSATPLTALPPNDLLATLKYHVALSQLSVSNFSQPEGITVPTLLKGEQYNNRSAGNELLSKYGQDATGQVLYISATPISQAKFRVRQSMNQADMRSGLGLVTTVDAVDGKWDGGRFQIVEDVLQPPKPCSTTVHTLNQANNNLTGLDNALERAGLWNTLDHSPNVTCLAPNTAAFAAAGNPDSTLPVSNLTSALLFHTLPMPFYTDFIVNGTVVKSLSNDTVIITIKEDGIYFNDAKVVAQNVLTNNGVIHVLDRIMSKVNETASGSPTTTSLSSSSATASSSGKAAASSTAAAVMQGAVSGSAGLFGLIAAFLLM